MLIIIIIFILIINIIIIIIIIILILIILIITISFIILLIVIIIIIIIIIITTIIIIIIGFFIISLLGIGGLSFGQITTSIYLKVSISDFLTLFSARTGEQYFWSTIPANKLLFAGCFALLCSTVVAIVWPSSYPDGIYTLGLGRRKPYVLPVYIWLYCIVWWVIQDVIKVGVFNYLKKNNIFGYNDTGKRYYW